MNGVWGLFSFLGCGPGRGEIQMNGLLDHRTQILHNHNSIQSVISITILYNPYLLVA